MAARATLVSMCKGFLYRDTSIKCAKVSDCDGLTASHRKAHASVATTEMPPVRKSVAIR